MAGVSPALPRPPAATHRVAILLLLTLAACGGGAAPDTSGSGGGGGGGGDPYGTLAAKSSFSAADVRHLLARTTFGRTPADVDAVTAAGVPAHVDGMLQLALPGSTSWDQAAEALLVNEDDPPGLEGGFPSPSQLAQWWETLMLTSGNQFQEVLALFWHDHFAASTSVLEGDSYHWMKAHVNLFRGEGAGNLRSLLVKVSRDWVMLKWLDGVISTKNAPNENYAREFWELFTRGVDNGYGQPDIVEAARAFTGYRQRFDAVTGQSYVQFDPNRHDAGAKTILGVTIPGQNLTDDVQAVVDLTLDGSTLTSEWIARKLLEGFCYLAPPDAVVGELAGILRDQGYELAPVLRALFLSEAFYSEKAREGLVKSPVEHAVGFVRSTGLTVRIGTLDATLVALGQRPTQPPTVNGWPGGPLWLSAQGMIDRTNHVRNCITARTLQASLGIDVGALLPSPGATSAEVVDALADRLNVVLAPSEHDRCVEYLDTQRLGDGTVVADPFDPTSATDVDERVRGLLYVLAQHPTYLVR
jgi:hypothetical protein